MSKNDRMVYQRSSGELINKKNSSERESSISTTQQEAIKKANEIYNNL